MSEIERHPRCAVVGGGISGIAAAHFLRLRHFDVEIIEKDDWHARLMQRYMDHVVALAAERDDVYRRLLHVMHMLAPPSSLLAPDIATRIALRSAIRTRSRSGTGISDTDRPHV